MSLPADRSVATEDLVCRRFHQDNSCPLVVTSIVKFCMIPTIGLAVN